MMHRAALVALLTLVSASGYSQSLVPQAGPASVEREVKVVDGRQVEIVKITMPLTVVEPMTSVSGGSQTAEWCAQDTPSDCLRLAGGGEVVTGVFADAGSPYAEGIGYRRGNALSMAFRRLNSPEIGFATLIFRDDHSADARTFNPDGSQRWRGVYVRTTR